MGGSYRQCTECGKRALSIATRCPGCGRELPAPAVPEVASAWDLRRFLSPRVVGWTIAVAVVLTAAFLARSTGPRERQPSAASEMAYTTAAARLDTATAAPSSAAPSSAAPAGEVLVARTWTHVRQSRSRHAGIEAVLLPGDTVVADSLARGWYRVALEGEVLGYVYHSTLTRP